MQRYEIYHILNLEKGYYYCLNSYICSKCVKNKKDEKYFKSVCGFFIGFYSL